MNAGTNDLRRRVAPVLIVLAFASVRSGLAGGRSGPGPLLFRNARIYALGGGNDVLESGSILVQNGKIGGVGARLEAPAGSAVIDLGGRTVIPGLVCPAASLFLGPREASFPGEETPDADVLDGVDPFSPPLAPLLRGGVTTVHIGLRSFQTVGGMGAVIKLKCDRPPFEVLRARASLRLKMDRLQDGKTSNLQRLLEYEGIRRLFFDAREYRRSRIDHERRHKEAPRDGPQSEPPARDEAKEILLRVLDGEIPLRLEAHRPDALLNIRRLEDEFGIRIMLEGGERWLEAFPDGLRAPSGLIFNPLIDPGRFLIPGGPKGYAAGRLKIGASAFFYEDRPGGGGEAPTVEDYRRLRDRGTVLALMPPDEFPLSAAEMRSYAALLVSQGFTEIEALKAITLDAARILGVSDRVGSLEAGKDADLVILDGPPLNTLSRVERVYLDGAVVWEKIP